MILNWKKMIFAKMPKFQIIIEIDFMEQCHS